MRITTIILLGLLVVTGCGRAATSVLPLSANEVQVLVSTASRCGETAAQELAFQQAAVATIQRGFDRFVIAGTGTDSQAVGVLHLPSSTNTYGSTTYSSGGFSTVIRRNQNILTVRMFHASDQGAEHAIDARESLGLDWQAIVDKGPPEFC